jgi:Na+/proline symporter
MSPTLVLSLIAGYFTVLIIISLLTSRQATSASFFVANRNAPWFMVAFAMIGTSLSGVTFVSIPGQVLTGQWSYMGMVFGYVAGYAVIATVLLPLYYKLNLVSIYTYLEQRFGFWSYKTGAFFFLLSRGIGAAFRLFLVAGVLQVIVFDALGVPFAVTVSASILLIYLYTFRGGLKTILWTDTFQTLAMLLCVIVSIGLIANELNLGWSGLVRTVQESPMSKVFYFDDANDKKYFWKLFAAGMFITITMTGLDQDMMQKNLSCRSLRDAQKNMLWFTLTLVFVNLLFLSLGVLLYKFADAKGIALDQLPQLLNLKGKLDTDKVFPYLATNPSYFPLFAGVVFVLGIIAVTYASADSALTALTTSFCVDFLGIDRYPEAQQKRMRQAAHLGFTVVLIVIILIFRALNDQNVVSAVFDAAGYTYGPLLGLYAFGLYTSRRPTDGWVPVVCVLAPVLTWILVKNAAVWFGGYEIGFEKLIYNGLITFVGLWAISRPATVVASVNPAARELVS